MAVAGRFVRGCLHSKVLFGTPKAGCYTHYRGDRLLQIVSVQTDRESVRTIVLGRYVELTVNRGSTVKYFNAKLA